MTQPENQAAEPTTLNAAEQADQELSDEQVEGAVGGISASTKGTVCGKVGTPVCASPAGDDQLSNSTGANVAG